MRKSEIHMHSVFSDGEFTPTELVAIAEKNRVSILSLTDHDTFEGIDEFLAASSKANIDAFPGIEITVAFHEFQLHILAYFKDAESILPDLREEVKEMADTRADRMRQLVDRINQVVPEEFRGKILFENVRRAAEGVLARPHLAREMVRLGIVPSTREAFEKYLVEHNVMRKNLSAERAISLVRESNGIPVLAHPGERTYALYNPRQGREYSHVPPLLEELTSNGLLGIECVYPYHEKIGKVDYYKGLAKDFGLIVTGSRDFHGFTTHQSAKILGETRISDRFFEQFAEVWE